MIQGKNDINYCDTLNRYWGRPGWLLGIWCPVAIIYGGLFIYMQYLSQMLYPLVLAIQAWSTGQADIDIDTGVNFHAWSSTYASVIVFFMLQIILLKRDMSSIMRIVSFGGFFIIVIMGLIIGIGIKSLIDTKFIFTSDPAMSKVFVGDTRYIMLFNTNYGPLAGVYCCGYFLHVSALPMLKKNRVQANNERDINVGYSLVCLSYLAAGIIGYFGFAGQSFADKQNEYFKQSGDGMTQNCLYMFSSTNGIAFVMRFLIFCLIFLHYPLINFFTRTFLMVAIGVDDEKLSNV